MTLLAITFGCLKECTNYGAFLTNTVLGHFVQRWTKYSGLRSFSHAPSRTRECVLNLLQTSILCILQAKSHNLAIIQYSSQNATEQCQTAQSLKAQFDAVPWPTGNDRKVAPLTSCDLSTLYLVVCTNSTTARHIFPC